MVDCLTPATFTAYDPYHLQNGIDVLNELVADLHRHEEHIGEERSLILDSTDDDITTQLLGGTKTILTDVLSQVGNSLLILIGAEIEGNAWCDLDETSYSGPNSITNWPQSVFDHWELPVVIDDIRDILTNLLCICPTVPVGQELWFTLIADASMLTSPHKILQGIQPPGGSSTGALNNLKSSPIVCEFSFGSFEPATFTVSMHFARDSCDGTLIDQQHFCTVAGGTFPELCGGDINQTFKMKYKWALDSLTEGGVDGFTNDRLSDQVRPDDVIVGIHSIWIRPVFRTSVAGGQRLRQWEFEPVPFKIEVSASVNSPCNFTTIWEGSLDHVGLIQSSDIQTDEAGAFVTNITRFREINPPIVEMPELNLQEGQIVRTSVDIQNIPGVQDLFSVSGSKSMSCLFSIFSRGLITVKVIRPAR